VSDSSGERVVGRWAGRISRRQLLLAGAAATGCAVLGITTLAPRPSGDLAAVVVDRWRFGPFTPGCTEADFDERGLTEVGRLVFSGQLTNCYVMLRTAGSGTRCRPLAGSSAEWRR
jgi:hypothetical protein